MNGEFLEKPKNNTKYVVGGIVGLGIGLLAAYLFARASEENGNDDLHIGTIDMIKLAVAVLAIVRQVADLGSKKD